MPFRLAGPFLLAAIAGAGAGCDTRAAEAPPAATPEALVADALPAGLRDFYAARALRPLWFTGGRPRAESERLLTLLEENSGTDDSLDEVAALRRLLSVAPQNLAALARAEAAFTMALLRYADDRSASAPRDVIFIDRELAPSPHQPAQLLALAGEDLHGLLARLPRLHPFEDALRQKRAAQRRERGDARNAGPTEDVLAGDIGRARMLPRDGRKHIVVDTASARLWMVEHGRVAGSMRVVVGAPGSSTPQLAGLIRFVTLNPYWNVPPDLIRARFAPLALRGGAAALAAQDMEMLSGFGPQARPLPFEEVDWQGVVDGQLPLRMRQRPGPRNMMGDMKFMLPNDLGIYLHDTPDKAAFGRRDRALSAGCVRVEDADRLARWLFGHAVRAAGDGPEQRLDLPEPVPVYITSFSAAPGL